MPNKRRKRSQTLKISCPCCEKRLWRIGSQKHFLFYKDKNEIKKELGISNKKATFLAAKTSAFVDRNSWIEEFFCENDGQIWMHISQKLDGKKTATPVKSTDWARTTGTIDPERPNPSVSQYSSRMSRGVKIQNSRT
jgi:hypothetical protein